MKISYSGITTFRQCPAKYKFYAIDRIRTPQTPEQYFGALMHSILQFTLKEDPHVPTLGTIIAEYDRRWRPSMFATSTMAATYYSLGKEMIKGFLALHRPGFTSVIATEKFFNIPLMDHQITGKIDRVDQLPFGGLEIIDYKTSKALPSQSDIDNDLQLSLYHLAATHLWPEASSIRLTFHFLRHGERITTTRTSKQTEELINHVKETISTIQTSSFTPTPNPLCPWCEYRHLCPLSNTPKYSENKYTSQNDLEESPF